MEKELDEVNWPRFVQCTKENGKKHVEAFKAGRLKRHLKFWQSITYNPFIISLATGAPIEFEATPIQNISPRPFNFNSREWEKINMEVKVMLKKGIIEKVDDSEDVFVSNIFTRNKSDGTLRVILDLSNLNEYVEYKHFKMESIQQALDLMVPSCYMASIDWKDAYYCVPVARRFRKYMVFSWGNEFYQYTCLPNGLASAPRYFTRLSKVLFSELRKQGFLSTSYIDDCLLVANSLPEARQNVAKTVEMSNNAGFIVHPEKSVLNPTQEITYLGFVLNSKTMTIKITRARAVKIKERCFRILKTKYLTVHKLSQAIGLMVASFQGVKYGKLHYRNCDNQKSEVLREGKGNFQTSMTLAPNSKCDLEWWVQNIEQADNSIGTPSPDIIIETDASNIGWGACVRGDKRRTTGGKWSRDEVHEHINYLEMLAAWLSIQCFAKGRQNYCIKILSDNTTTVAYLNHLGGTKLKCNRLAQKIWAWCEQNNNWIVAAHIPGVKNVVADRQSRTFWDNMEWQLCPDKFKEICKVLGTPDIDLFATRLNHQLPRYVAWKPDPGAEAVNAFVVHWGNYYSYIFPPFNLISRVLSKIDREKATAIVVAPFWPTQPWFPKFLQLCTHPPYVLSSRHQTILQHPQRDSRELPRAKLLVGLTSGQPLDRRSSQKPLKTFSWLRGKAPQKDNTHLTSETGISCVWRGQSIQLPLM